MKNKQLTLFKLCDCGNVCTKDMEYCSLECQYFDFIRVFGI